MGSLADPPAAAGLEAPTHPAIDEALAAFPPDQARRAGTAIRWLLRTRLASSAPDAWSGSRLTGDGFPFELAFSTSDDRLRFTVEPGAGDLLPRERLALAAGLVALMGEAPVARPVLDDLRRLQGAGPLAYGVWIGVRAGSGGVACKLYVEMPADAVLPGPCAPMLGDRVAAPRMLAYTPSTRAFESYYRVPSLEGRHLAAALAPAGLAARADELVGFIEEAYGHRVRGRLPGPSVGLSYVAGRATLHFYARSMWGSDARIRRGFARVARASGWDDEAYLRVTAPIAGREDWRTRHGLFGITLDASRPTSLGIGVRPGAP